MKNKENNFISAVIYVHNNEQAIKPFIEMLDSVLKLKFKKYEIICVEDGSDDNSAKLIREAAEEVKNGTVVLISTGFYQGLESSMIAGVDFASGDFVFEFDSILVDYESKLIIDVYNRCISGYDIVGASSSLKQRKTSRIFYKLFNKYSKTPYRLRTESFRILSRRAINRINQMSLTIPYRKAVYANCGFPYDSISYDVRHT
ncbi:MAG: glycosyltransferase, partial [Lachnoclostridium sp.]|nr:glycosyltransferase [Lachnoclostridium sp.]